MSFSPQSLEASKQHIPPVIGHQKDFIVDYAEGSWVYSTDGDRYLDFTSGVSVTNTGYCHPRVVAAAQAQAAKLIHCFQNLCWHQPMLELTGKLMTLVPEGLDRVIYGNTGADATEGAVKLAKQVTRRSAIIAFEGAYHGRSHLTMPMTCCKVHFRGHYEPLVGSVYRAPFPDPYRMDGVDPTEYCLKQLDLLFRREVYPDDVAAMVIEPVQGEGGSLVAPPAFIRGLRELCDRHGIVLIFAEQQTGYGRTGTFFAAEHYDVAPDVMMLAKAMASGFPLSAVVGRAELMDAWAKGTHGGVFNGNVVSCAAGVATIDAILEEDMLGNCARQGEKLRAFLRGLQEKYAVIGDVRGLGLMNVVELVKPDGGKEPNEEAQKKFLAGLGKRNMLIMGVGTYENMVRFLPPINITDEDMATATDIISAAAAEAF
jgi:4-aminobutyrate aminotransferase